MTPSNPLYLSRCLDEAKSALAALAKAQLETKETIHPYDLVQLRNCVEVLSMPFPKEQLAAYERKDAA